ncbi:unnamed protein product, partial [Darwinula stevensoni]
NFQEVVICFQLCVKSHSASLARHTASVEQHGTPPMVMNGTQVARVVASRNNKYINGTAVFANVGWRTHTLIKPEDLREDFMGLMVLPTCFSPLPISLGLGACGMP